MRKILSLFLACILVLTVFAQNKTSNLVLKEFISLKELKSASISVFAENLTTNNIIFDYQSDLALAPASVLKLVPTSLALELFGPEHKFKTELAYSGIILPDGTLLGDVYIIGYGDPCLGSNNFTETYGKGFEILNKWTDEIKKLKIKKIKGNIIADISYFGKIEIPNNWIWEDIANYYGNQGSCLCFNDNLYSLHFKTGNFNGAATEIIKIEPQGLNYEFENLVVSSSSSGDNAYIFYTNTKNYLQVKGSLPWKNNNFVVKGSIREPDAFLASSFYNIINSNGISIEGQAKVIDNFDNKINRTVFYVTNSPTLSEIVDYTNLKSFNLYAEVLAQHIMKKTGKTWNEAVEDFFKKKSIDTNGLKLSDACGLSRFNAITSRQIAGLLKYMRLYSTNKEKFFSSLAIAGASGTMAKFGLGTPVENKLHAKSGSISGVRAYAGYVYNTQGDEIVVSIIINNYSATNQRIKKIFEDFFGEIALLK